MTDFAGSLLQTPQANATNADMVAFHKYHDAGSENAQVTSQDEFFVFVPVKTVPFLVLLIRENSLLAVAFYP